MATLEINGLVKNFRDFSLGPIDLELEAGCALGLIGANGAGKSTLFRSLIGTLCHDQGSVRVLGAAADKNNVSWKTDVGYVGDFTPLYEYWSGAKNLTAFARFYPTWSMERAKELASRLNLDLNKKVKTYSTGQRTKLAIIIALSHSPKLLLLDEPSTGLDPVARDSFNEILFEIMESGHVALAYATHHVSEIERLIDRLVFISDGHIIRDEIKEDLSEQWRLITFHSEKPLTEIPQVLRRKSEQSRHELISQEADVTIRYLQENGAEKIESSRISVERIAVEILKQSIVEMNNV